MSKLWTINCRERGVRAGNNDNSLISGEVDPELPHANQAFSYADVSLTRSELSDLLRFLWGTTIGTPWARVWVVRHCDDLPASARHSRTCATPRQSLRRPKSGRLSYGISEGDTPAPVGHLELR